MNCPKCSEPVESGAAFCGNCGQQIHAANPSTPGVPNYARPVAGQASRETKALLSVIFGVVGIFGTLLMPLIGLVSGITGIAMGTMSRRSNRRHASSTGIFLSVCALVIGMAGWVYGVTSDKFFDDTAGGFTKESIPAAATFVAAEISTPCYTINLVDRLNISNDEDSCDLKALDGRSLDESKEVYKIFASKSDITNADTLNILGKKALEKDIKETLPGFEIDSQQATTFAGSPAYVIHASDRENNVAVVEGIVLHQTSGDKNLFVLLHAENGTTTDLQTLEGQWRWK